MIVYLDTSAVVKLLLDEEGSDDAAMLWSQAAIRVTSMLTYAEARAALAAAVRARRLSTAMRDSAAMLLEGRWTEMAVIAVDDAIVRDAGAICDASAVRASDAVHLASARALADGGVVVFSTWDRVQADAASSMGLAVAPA